MTPAGLILMLSSVLSVLVLTIYCFYKVFTAPPRAETHLHAPLDIDTGDLDT